MGALIAIIVALALVIIVLALKIRRLKIRLELSADLFANLALRYERMRRGIED